MQTILSCNLFFYHSACDNSMHVCKYWLLDSSRVSQVATQIHNSLDSHQVPLFRVAGIVEGYWSLRAAKQPLLGVPQDMRVSSKDVPSHWSSVRIDRAQ